MQALTRKLKSTKMELLRCSINELQEKRKQLDQVIGFDYLTITRRGPKESVTTLLEKINSAVRAEEEILYRCHSKKWHQQTLCDYPCAPYFCEYDFCFPF